MDWEIFNTKELIRKKNLDTKREMDLCIGALIVARYSFRIWIKDKWNLLMPITVATCDFGCITNYILLLEIENKNNEVHVGDF